jgi:hypothetical protein
MEEGSLPGVRRNTAATAAGSDFQIEKRGGGTEEKEPGARRRRPADMSLCGCCTLASGGPWATGPSWCLNERPSDYTARTRLGQAEEYHPREVGKGA